jgi:hypothetical protein
MDVSPHDYSEDIPIEDTLEPTLEDTTPPWKMNPPCKLLLRNPKFLSMPYQFLNTTNLEINWLHQAPQSDCVD